MLWSRGGIREQRILLVVGIVIFAVWLGWFVFAMLLYAQVIMPFNSPFSLSYAFETIPFVALFALVLTVGFSLRLATKAARWLFLAFVLVELAGIAIEVARPFSLAQAAVGNSLLYGMIVIAPESFSTLGVFFLLLLALQARRDATVPPTSAPPPVAPPVS